VEEESNNVPGESFQFLKESKEGRPKSSEGQRRDCAEVGEAISEVENSCVL